MLKIVDSHVHLLPGRLAEKVRGFLNSHLDMALPYPLDHAVILDRLQQAGISEIWNLPYSHKRGVAAGLNRASAATITEFREHSVKIIGGATVHPADANLPEILSEAFDDLGLQVLKLHCSVGDFRLSDERLTPVWDFIAARRIPTIIHIGHNVSGHTEAPELNELAQIAENYPTAPIIIAHCGHHAGEAALDLVEKYPAIYADLTPVVNELVQISTRRVRQLASKLLFGSDVPNVALSVEESLAHVRSFGLPAELEAAILGGNAQRLLLAISH